MWEEGIESNWSRLAEGMMLEISWTFRISSGVSEGIYNSVVQSDWEFLRIEAGRRQ